MIFIITREDAIEILKDGAWWSMVDIMLPCDGAASKALHDAVDTAIAALRAQQKLLEMLELDRDAWKLCDGCRPNRFFGNRFCCRCGRPLTEGAWAELERRIGGDDETD